MGLRQWQRVPCACLTVPRGGPLPRAPAKPRPQPLGPLLSTALDPPKPRPWGEEELLTSRLLP